MDWKKKLSKLSGRMTKENWIVLLCLGLIIMIIAMPWSEKAGNKNTKFEDSGRQTAEGQSSGTWKAKVQEDDAQKEDGQRAGAFGEEDGFSGETALSSYEALLEQRVKEVLKQVEGVGTVDVLIVLKSSEERVYRTDGKTSQSSTKELDSSGGSREISQQEEEYATVLSSGGSSLGEKGGGPLLEKELRPEISGIVISAQGGGSPKIKAEITEAMEALFGLPAHKIKVLKRVE